MLLCLPLSLASQLLQAQNLPIPAAPQLAAESYMLVDFKTGTVITEKNPDKQIDPASLTKMMTAYIVSSEIAYRGLLPEDLVLVSRKAHKAIGSRTFLEPESQVTVRDLMYGLVVQSGNDASIALAEHVGGSEEGFVSMMNQFAERLGMTSTNYVNSTGLPHPDHKTTARDLAILARAVINDFPKHYRLYSVKEFTYNDIKQRNRNELLLRDSTVDGIKTGHTKAAGFCLVASAERDGMRLISVLMGARNANLRSTESIRALNYGFRFYESVPLATAGATLGHVRVWGGRKEKVVMGSAEAHHLTLQTGKKSELHRSFDIASDLVAPVSSGQQVGQLEYRIEGELVAQLPLVALESIERAGFVKRSWDSLRRIFK